MKAFSLKKRPETFLLLKIKEGRRESERRETETEVLFLNLSSRLPLLIENGLQE